MFVLAQVSSTTRCPRLLPHDAVVGEHFGDGGPARQQIELVGRARLELAAVLADGWADRDDARFSSDRRAAGQRDRKSGGEGRSVSVGVDLGGRRIVTKKQNTTTPRQEQG